MGKLSKIKGIELIGKELAKGVTKVEIMANFGKQWQTPKDTFNKWYLIAFEDYQVQLQAKEAERQALVSKNLSTEISAQIATEQELDLILSKIARGDVQVESWINGEIVLKNVSPSDVAKAADLLYKRKGSYAPTKQANTDTEGNSMPTTFVIQSVVSGTPIDESE
jgi:hypothetical protein